MTASSSVNPNLDYSRLLSMQAQTHVQSFTWVGVASITSALEAWFQTSGCTVISSWNYPILPVDYYGSDWAFHAVGSTLSYIRNLHKILFPWRSERLQNVLFFLDNLLFQKLNPLPVTYSDLYPIQALLKLFIILFVIFSYKFLKILIDWLPIILD